jgi:hypothetical protein
MHELLKAIDAEKIAAVADTQANINSVFIQRCDKIAEFI